MGVWDGEGVWERERVWVYVLRTYLCGLWCEIFFLRQLAYSQHKLFINFRYETHIQRNIKHKHTTQRYQLSTGTSCDSLKKEREEHKIPSRPETQQIRKGCVLLNLCLFLARCFTSKTQTGFLDFEDPRQMTCQQRQQNLLQLALTSCCRNITSFTFASIQGI